MSNVDIRTRVELKNETIRGRSATSKAGRVALIGAFPSSKSKPFVAESFAQVVSHYGVKLNSPVTQFYGGVRAAKRIFMEGIKGYTGASSVTCLNICRIQPEKLNGVKYNLADLYDENLGPEYEKQYDYINGTYLDGEISVETSNDDLLEFPDEIFKNDMRLTFDKLKQALQLISDEDMDLLFIANDLWDVLDSPYMTTINRLPPIVKPTSSTTGKQYIHVVVEKETDVDLRFNDGTVREGQTIYHPILTVNKEHKYVLKCPYKVDKNGELVLGSDNKPVFITTKGENDPIVGNYLSKSQEIVQLECKDVVLTKTTDNTTTYLNVWDDTSTVTKIVLPEKEDGYPNIEWKVEHKDEHGNNIYGVTQTKKLIRNIGDVYDYILDYVDNEFTSHRPVNYIGAVTTKKGDVPEGLENNSSITGIPSKIIRVNSETKDYDNLPETTDAEKELKARYTPTEENPYANIVKWGAVDIAKLFTRTTNELSTCGLFYQRGVINKEQVDAMELAAHMCGFICSLKLDQDLTYRTIPALTEVYEEAYLGENDAGTLLNQAGIQVIRPKSRLDKTFYVNNSVMPAGWHTNHVRSVTYLLKQLKFEEGLGMNNFTANIESYQALLEATVRDVMDECEVIRDVEIGDIEIINSYHIYVPISIILAGVVTLINVGVSMALDETGGVGTYIKSTSGYSMSF